MDKIFHPTFYSVCNSLSMLALKFVKVAPDQIDIKIYCYPLSKHSYITRESVMLLLSILMYTLTNLRFLQVFHFARICRFHVNPISSWNYWLHLVGRHHFYIYSPKWGNDLMPNGLQATTFTNTSHVPWYASQNSVNSLIELQRPRDDIYLQ